jgi:hypothetical protein
MRATYFTDRNEPGVLVEHMPCIASPAADEVNRPDRHSACILLDKTQLLLDERSVVLRRLALDDPHDSFARPRIAFGE